MEALTGIVPGDPLVAAAVLVIVVAGSVVQAALGMGFGLTVAPLLAILSPAFVPVATLWLGGATALAGALRERRGIAWREVAVGNLGRVVGVALGVWVLVSVAERGAFSLVFGTVIAGAVLLSAFGVRLAMNARNLVAMGSLSGFMGAITSVGAPPLALIYQGVAPATARPTLAAFFVIGCLLNLIGAYGAGYGTGDDVLRALYMAPAALAGTLIGRRLKGRVDTRFRPILLGVAGAAACILIGKGFVLTLS